MIKYCGRAVSFVQYLPKKPIEHGMKVFVLCYAYTGYLLSFETYLGTNIEIDENAALHIVNKLITREELTTSQGRALYTDNW